MLSLTKEAQWVQLSELIADRMGLYFPPDRWNDLERGVAGAAQEFGFGDTAQCIDWLLTAPPEPDKAMLQVLASHLTIGETYFFRDHQTLDALAQTILPELIRDRRGHQQRLRIWSAACCSGEEPYSLAILLHQLLPDLQDWQVTIIATDINPRFLHKAAAGVFGEWSFRNAPNRLKQRYFNRTADGRYAITPEIKKLVKFRYLNLVEDVYPSPATDTHAMDIIFCRNVLMYFSPPQIDKVIGNLSHALIDGGWLAVSPSEASKTLFPQFINVNFPGAILFQKGEVPTRTEPAPMEYIPITAPGPIEVYSPWIEPSQLAADAEPAPLQQDQSKAETKSALLASAQSLYRQGRYEKAADTILATLAEYPPLPGAFPLLTRALANQGRLTDALTWCERWIAADKLDPAAYYLHAMVLIEQEELRQARASLQKAVYLDHDFVLANFALGTLARSRGKPAEADKHFANAHHGLRAYQPDDLLPESDGLTAGRLAQTLAAIINAEPMQ